jgi:uncharacterized RDD family membrane protein YckC
VGAASAAPAEPVAPAVQPVSGPKLAFWWERFLAWLIDMVIVAFALVIVGFFTSLFGAHVDLFTTFAAPWWVTIFISVSVYSIVLFGYWTFMEGAYGQSIGKMFLQLRVARVDGGQVDMGRAAISSVGKSFLLFWDVLLGLIFYPRRRQRVFSHFSETVVTKVT